MLARVREMAATRCTGWGLLEFNGEADHVHLLVALPPNLDLSRFVNNLKTTSSRLLRKKFADRLKAGLSQARILVPLVLYHHLWRGAAIDPETVHRATTQPRIGAPFTSSQAQGARCLEHWAIGGQVDPILLIGPVSIWNPTLPRALLNYRWAKKPGAYRSQ